MQSNSRNRFVHALIAGAFLTLAHARAQGPDLAAKVDALAANYLAKPGGVGLSIAVGRLGEIELAKGYGLADAEFDVKADADTLFRIGSVTKQFTAAAIMRLIEEHKLALDDDLSKHVPSFPLQGKHVTIEQLLTHTSGIVSYTDLDDEWTPKWPLELTDDQLLDLVDDKPFVSEPGTKWAYNNTGYYLLGMLIANVSGKSYADYVRTEFVEPLELGRLRYDSNFDLIKNRAQGYAFERGVLSNDHALGMSQPGAAGGLIASARELVRWQIALTSGNVVSKESFARMRTPTVLPDGTNTHYGFGLTLGEFEGLERVQHGGGIFGFNSVLMWFPASDVHIAVISNGESVSSAKLADEIAYVALGIARPVAKDEALSAERIAQLVGEYRLTANGMGARVFEQKGKLMLQPTGQDAFRLMSQGGDEFRADFDNAVKIVFGADGKGFTLHQGGKTTTATRVK